MAEKYIDLAPQIASMHDQPIGTVRVVLGLLDEFASEHPDQVPGRTITESGYSTVVEWAKTYALNGWRGRDVLADIGITVVPDPEPTNAEKLAEAITNAAHGVGIGSTTANIKAIAEHLDDAGVKAPGGDE